MNKKEIGDKIHKLRLENGVSTYVLRQEKWSNTTIINIEKAGSNYTIDSLLKLCDRIGAKITVEKK
jgi:transcriptional regulator with XRE-family HTH domain